MKVRVMRIILAFHDISKLVLLAQQSGRKRCRYSFTIRELYQSCEADFQYWKAWAITEAYSLDQDEEEDVFLEEENKSEGSTNYKDLESPRGENKSDWSTNYKDLRSPHPPLTL